MSIRVQIFDYSARITMSGRFDFQVHRDFKGTYMPLLDNAAVCEIEIEMSHVDYMDSSALGMLMLLKERTKVANKSVSLLNVSGTVSQMLEVANFSKVFSFKQTALFQSKSRQSPYGNLQAVF